MSMENSSTTSSLPALPWTGHCACNHIRYSLSATPLVIHCCHCHQCQIETGSVSAVNLIIESSNLSLAPDSGTPFKVPTPSASGKGQLIARCPKCYVALYSHYAGSGPYTSFIRLGTLDVEYSHALKPEMHIYQTSKMPWFVVPEGEKCFEEFYKPSEEWRKEALERWLKLKPEVEKWKKEVGGWEYERLDEKVEKLSL